MASEISLIVFCALFACCCSQRVYREVDASQKDGSQPASIPKTETVIHPEPIELHNGCGWHNKYGVGPKITGGNPYDTQFGEFPWMVAILLVDGENPLRYKCGGSLIAPQWILTAAHCVHDSDSNAVVVRAGEWDRNNTNEYLKHADRPVKEIIIHESYDSQNIFNNVALLFVEEPFVWQDNIRPICLPELNYSIDTSRCYFSGWGKTQPGEDIPYQMILGKANLTVIPHDTCLTKIRRELWEQPNFNIHDSFFCALGKNGESPCEGDGGSPLMCPMSGNKDRYYQVGIAALHFRCGARRVPALFANIEHARPWISKILTAKNVPPSHFTP